MHEKIKSMWPILSISAAVSLSTLNWEFGRSLVLWFLILFFVYLTAVYSVKKTGIKNNKILVLTWSLAFLSYYLPSAVKSTGGLDDLYLIFPYYLLTILGILLIVITSANRKLLVTFVVVGIFALTLDSIGIKTPRLPYTSHRSASISDNSTRCFENYIEHQGFPFKRSNYDECKNDGASHTTATLVNAMFWVILTIPAYYVVSKYKPNRNNS